MLSTEIKFDPLFTSKFYELKDFAVKINFPIPNSDPTKLQEFLRTDEGKAFKSAFSAELQKLKTWSEINQLKTESLEKFERNYVDYSGVDESVNKLYLPLYTEGVRALVGINQLLESNEISLDMSVDVIKNLLNSIAVCAPGAYTHFEDAYSKLLAFVNASILFMDVRREIATQYFLALASERKDIKEGYEIHYANAILNFYSDMLHIKELKDEYSEALNEEILSELDEKFRDQITKLITPESVVKNIRYRMGLASTIDKLNLITIIRRINNDIKEMNKHAFLEKRCCYLLRY